ncbi:hypothetical protein ACIP01_20600 [Pseudomonas monteilii]|uniref:hypothetical protein n=1 Tax=Pseudomonas monteilii TaxID=76759 RepID=UPI00382B8813
MKTITYRKWLVIAGSALLAACSSWVPPKGDTSSTVTQLFTLEPTPDRSTLQKTATGYLATLLADPANQEINLIKVDPTLVSNNTQDLAVTLPNGKTAQFHLRDFNTMTPGIDGWVGYKPSAWKQTHPSSASEIDIDPLYYLSLTRDGDKLVGSVTVEGQPYRIESVSPGQYLLIKVDASKSPPKEAPFQTAGTAVRDKTAITAPTSTHSVIRVLFVTTNQLRKKNPNNRAEAANWINTVNQHMKNSQVDITFEIADFYDMDFDETGLGNIAQLNAIRHSQQAQQMRDNLRGDIVAIYSSLGESFGIAPPNKDNAWVIFGRPSELGYLLGRRLGAMDFNAPGEGGYHYGYRQMAVNPKFLTQMAYACLNCPGAVVIPYFSNPRLKYQGVPMGTVERNDVARHFNEQRETVENYYPEPTNFKTLRNIKREQLGLPACLKATEGSKLAFTDCKGDWENNSRRQWHIKMLGLFVMVKNLYASDHSGWPPCVRYRANGQQAELVQCPTTAGEGANDGTAWYYTGSTIRRDVAGLTSCLSAKDDANEVFTEFCTVNNANQQWHFGP